MIVPDPRHLDRPAQNGLNSPMEQMVAATRPAAWFDEEVSMKSRRRLAIMLSYAAAVFLCAKAQAGAAELTTQITLAALYLGPAVILHFVINWIWGDETPDSTDKTEE